LHASLVLADLHGALKRRRPPKGLLHHTDRGSQYVDEDYIKALEAAGIERSMSHAETKNRPSNRPKSENCGVQSNGAGQNDIKAA
jgi:transposase InsO family protein